MKAGHEVLGLVRSDSSAEKVKSLGATPVQGNLTDTKFLAETASKADAVLHLGFNHDFSKPYQELIATDIAAVNAMGQAMSGSNKPLVHTSGTATVDSDNGKETPEEFRSRSGLFELRAHSEQEALKLCDKGVRAMVIRLAPYVFGRGGSYFVPTNIEAAAKHGFAPYVNGDAMTSTADVDAAADLYLLAMEKGRAGAIYNCTTETDVTIKKLAETIATALGIKAKNVSLEEANEMCGPFTAQFLLLENRASSAKAREELGWNPHPKYSVCEDILRGSYQPMIQKLRQSATAAK